MITQDLFGHTNAKAKVQTALAINPTRKRQAKNQSSDGQTTKAALHVADLFAPPIVQPAAASVTHNAGGLIQTNDDTPEAVPNLENACGAFTANADASDPAPVQSFAPEATLPQERPVSKRVQSRLTRDIVVCPTPPTTFTEALQLIAASGTVDEERQKTFRREVNWVQSRLPAKRDGSPAEPLPCDPLLLRPILQKIQPGRHKISTKRWSNIRNELAAIQRKTGWLSPRNGQAVLQSHDWNYGLNLITDTAPRAMFRAFAAYCEAAGIEPGAVTPTHLPLYKAHLDSTKVTIRPSKTVDALRYGWNKLCREHPDWGGLPFPRKLNPLYIRDEADRVPAGFFLDLDAYIAKLRNPGLFDRRFPIKTAAATIRARSEIYKLSASVLAKSGWKPEMLTSLREIVTPNAVETILTDYHRRNCTAGDWTYGAETTAAALKTLAIQWGDLAPEDLAHVTEISAAVRCKKSAFPRKAQERLRQFDDKDVERRFWDLPRRLWQEVVSKHERQNRPKTAADVAKVALVLAISFDKPLRITNLRKLDLAHDFDRDTKGTIIGIKIEGERTTKGAAIIEGALSSSTQKMLKTFIEKYRPRLLKVPSSALVPGAKHHYLSDSRFRNMIEKAIAQHIGIDMNPHLIRSLIATVILDEDPRNVTLAQRTLDHKAPTTTLRSYAMQRGRTITAEYAATMHRRLKRLAK